MRIMLGQKLGHQVKLKRSVHSNGQSFDSFFIELFQNVYLHQIGASLGQGNISSFEYDLGQEGCHAHIWQYLLRQKCWAG